MNTAQLAALIAAVFFAAGVCVAAYALIKLARLLTEATRALGRAREQTDLVIRQAQAAIDRTNEQLDRTDAITANMNEVSANVAELTEHVSALAGLGRALAAGPVGKVAAVTYGVRHAVGMRRGGGVATGGVRSARLCPRLGRRRRRQARAPAGSGPDDRTAGAVMRRLLWLTVGAGLGISGYRRASRIVREFTGAGRPRAGPRAEGLARFARDVREGMDLYAEQQRLNSSGAELPAAIPSDPPGDRDKRDKRGQRGLPGPPAGRNGSPRRARTTRTHNPKDGR